MTGSTAVVIPEKTSKATFKQDVDLWRPEIGKLCTRGFTPERILAGALHIGLKNPQIFDCEPKSIFLALAKCARLALDPGEGIDLVPLNNTVRRKVNGEWTESKVLMLEAWTGYKGLKALAIRQNIIRVMEEFCVYQGDQFEYELGLEARLRHVPTSVAKRGKLTGAYSIIRLHGGLKTFHYMPIEDIERIRASSRAWGPRQVAVCPDWYAMKTVVRDYLNRQPQAGALGEALEDDDSAGPREHYDYETGEVLPAGQPQHAPPAERPPEDDLAEDMEIVEAEAGR